MFSEVDFKLKMCWCFEVLRWACQQLSIDIIWWSTTSRISVTDNTTS